MVEKEKNPNPIYIDPDLVEEISIRLPSKSILKFKTVSKQWRSILESRSFLERRMKLEKHRKILAAYICDCGDDRPSLLPESRFEDEEEIVYLHRGAARPSMACDGLVCFPETDWIIIVNPSTGQLVRFPSGLDKESSAFYTLFLNLNGPRMNDFPGFWAMGFGRDKVTGSYKVARMSTPVQECELLDVQTGVWRKLTPPPYRVSVVNKSACVNGSIYWLTTSFEVLSLNLNTEKFHHVSVPTMWVKYYNESIVNLDSRLAIAKTKGEPNWQLEIWCMDTDKEQWSKTYSISLAGLTIDPLDRTWFTPLTVSKLGNLVFCDNHKRLFKYYTESGEIRCLSSDIHVLSPYLENLVPLRSESGHYPDLEIRTSRRCSRLSPSSGISKFFNRWGFGILDIVSFTTVAIVSHIVFPKKFVILGYLSTRVLSSLLVDLIRDH